MNGLFPQFVGWWGSIPTSFRCFRPTVLLILTTLRPRDYHTFLLLACTTNGLLAAQTNNPTTCAILRTPSTFGLLQHLHDLTFLWLYAPGSWGKTSLLSDAFASILIRLPLNPVLRLFSGNRSGISQSNFYTTANTALKSDNLSEEWDSNPWSRRWQGRILPTVVFYQLNYPRAFVTSRLPYVSPADIVYRLPPYVRHPPYSVDLRFNASPTRSNFSVTLRAWLLWEDHFIIKCLQYVKEPFVFVLFELFIVPFNVYI